MISETSENMETALDLSKFKPGLIFDADGVCLFGKYHDEMSAWRAKKKWIEVLHDYFLLDSERDYEIKIISDLETRTFCLSCNFESACGRYTFWRLINHQAPEAERKLGGTIGQTIESQFHSTLPDIEEDETWILSPIEECAENNVETGKLLNRIFRLFNP
jgi:hypothetical protein